MNENVNVNVITFLMVILSFCLYVLFLLRHLLLQLIFLSLILLSFAYMFGGLGLALRTRKLR